MRLRLIQEISIKASGETFPRAKWLNLCESFGLDKGSASWLAASGSGFGIRASDVRADKRGANSTVWEVRLEALGTLDAHGLKLWMELCLAAQRFVERAKLQEIKIAVTATR